jgi:hypothetical protein
MGTNSRADVPSPNSAFAHISYSPLYVTLNNVLYSVQAVSHESLPTVKVRNSHIFKAFNAAFFKFFQVGTTFISQNVLRTTLILNVLSIC